MENHFLIDSKGKDYSYASMFSKPAVLETCADLMVMMVPFWMAIAIGLIVGWSWKPRWASFIVLGMRSRPRLVWSTPPGFGARRVWLALTAITAFPFLKEIWTRFYNWMWPDTISQGDDVRREVTSASRGANDWALKDEDLTSFSKKLDGQDGGEEWFSLMKKSAGRMVYQAWRREPSDGAGPGEYKSRTVFENVPVEILRDFFWDDDFRQYWDEMLISSKTWEECPRTGAMVVHWVRKFPIFCKNREYTISRRIWAAGDAYYCVTKAINYPKIPRQSAPRRVDKYFSSWCIRPVESVEGNPVACEVMLFHDEDMGVQRDLAKLGIRQGMWGCVKKMEPGLELYLTKRKQGMALSKSASFASIYSKVPSNFVQTDSSPPKENGEVAIVQLPEKPSKSGYMRWLVVGGAVALACGVDKGAVGKVIIFGMARRFGRISQKRRGVKY
ncbi:unnamed protein product [Calypogeia fissa]